MTNFRKQLCHPELLLETRLCLAKLPDLPSKTKTKTIPLVDSLMSGLAVFGLKFPSLLQYDVQKCYPNIKRNLKTLYHVDCAPCDTYLREQLDEVDPHALREPYKKLFALLQRGKALEGYAYWQDHYLISLDGTGQYSSNSVHCDNCCEKHHRNGSVEYYHQMLGAVLVHPDQKVVIPLAPEPIIKQDGHTKNDCERNAGKRLLQDMRREHPHLKIIIIEDGLASNGPHIELIKSLDMHYILGAKDSDHVFLFDWVRHSKYKEYEETTEDGVHHRYRFYNGAPLNDAYFHCEVNFLEYWETSPKGRVQHFSWVTDIPLSTETVAIVMKGGRARWSIENETFNTLKNQGYNFSHNYGHGYKNLCSVLTMLMMLAFMIDQIQELCCSVYKKARKQTRIYRELWKDLQCCFKWFVWESWEALYEAIATMSMPTPSLSTPNTS